MRRVKYSNEKGNVGCTIMGFGVNTKNGKKTFMVQFDGRDTIWEPEVEYFNKSVVEPGDVIKGSEEEFVELLDSLGIVGEPVHSTDQSVSDGQVDGKGTLETLTADNVEEVEE